MKKIILITICFLIIFSGCSAEYKFNRAKKLEKIGHYEKAIRAYTRIADRHSQTVYAPESLYRAGKLYQQKLKNYSKSQKLFSELLMKFPSAIEWKKLAELGIFNSPNYFPLFDDNLWVEGDSQSYGRNMRVERGCKKTAEGNYIINNKYYAGNKIVTTVLRYYVKKNYKLYESKEIGSDEYSILLDYPFNKDKSWTTVRDEQKVIFTIVDNNVTVEVRAGKFDNCLKIKEELLAYHGVYKYKYYAPDVGYILTTVASLKEPAERRHSELLSYKVTAE